jgi:hypothetical protein
LCAENGYNCTLKKEARLAEPNNPLIQTTHSFIPLPGGIMDCWLMEIMDWQTTNIEKGKV